jgi:hypothetical protein
MTYEQAFELIGKGAIIKYDDMYLLKLDYYGDLHTSIDGVHWKRGILEYDPPTEYSIFKIVRI